MDLVFRGVDRNQFKPHELECVKKDVHKAWVDGVWRVKLIVQAIIIFLVIGIFIFAYSVWPTPWIYNSWANTIYDPKTSKDLGIATAYRQSRLTGRLEAKYHGQWHSVFCGIDTCFVDDAR